MDVNGKITKVTWRIEILSAVNSKSKSMVDDGQITKVTWRIENFSSVKQEKLCSENFMVDGKRWQILIFPKGFKKLDHLSIFLDVADFGALALGGSRFAQLGFAVINQNDRKTSITKVCKHEFNAKERDWGFSSFMPLSELHDPKKGYLVNDACVIEAYVSTDRTEGLISDELIFETDSDKHKTKEADCVNAATENHKTSITKPEKITSPSPTQPSSQIVAIEREEPTDEDVKTFFTSLESELSSSNIVFSPEEAKEAVAKLDEVLNMTPVSFYDSGNFSPLKQAFKILASLDCSSTTLTIEEKNELLAMDERLKELADRAVKAVQDKNYHIEKKSRKLTITRNLDHNLIRYKEVESEVEHLMAERKEIFRSSKEMKMELEALGKECAEFEAKAKGAEEEEKTVEAEWGRMKDFISSIKGKF